MRDPKRILAKIIDAESDIERFEATGENLERLVEILREVAKCRKTRNWMLDSIGVDLAISPQTFFQLLDIPQINRIENSNRDLEVEVTSLKETRTPDAPVTVSNLNSVLRELYRNLHEIREKMRKEFPDCILSKDISADLIDWAGKKTSAMRLLRGQLTGYLLTAGRVNKIEGEFRERFPKSTRAHPLRKTLPQVERELVFYRSCLETNKKWEALGLDLFSILREDKLQPVLENLEGLGNQLWNIIYKSPSVKQSVELAGINFSDVGTLFDNDRVTVNNV